MNVHWSDTVEIDAQLLLALFADDREAIVLTTSWGRLNELKFRVSPEQLGRDPSRLPVDHSFAQVHHVVLPSRRAVRMLSTEG